MTSGITRDTAELSIINRFIKGYKTLLDIDLVIVSHRDKPDFEVVNTQTNEKLGVEITGLYQNATEAKIQYDREPNWDSSSGSWDNLITKLNTLLSEDFCHMDSRIKMPENKFREIWLILRDSTGQETELKALKKLG